MLIIIIKIMNKKVDNPATGEIIGNIPYCGAIETKQAIRVAEEYVILFCACFFFFFFFFFF